ncbi:biotin/lipoyl-binding protein [Microbacterium oxydans]|uniref:ATP-binding protein n=1 Tax=Microbacterium oxydans TaxID=82380 RepID=UPI0007342331|nr:biotin carboxylase N-terminal domain-containing protein [Microbacterium oxydans]KAB1891100.1 biotin/lipoyl-binding protein [Microbacterium oxydans]KTR78051.1 acetyl-COA carboxylase [Microbacterium oxydans]GED39034.1 acetyl/propionyl-CoA carboxylase subuit alpha [Microbacterium oxydans]
MNPTPTSSDVLFHTVLVANRGEIARRVIRTLRALGIRSVAVYSDADATSPHVREADLAVRIGPAPAADSYLDIDAVIAAARATGAQAIHPGYGFLSESVGLAEACEESGVVFIGPSVDALQIMGDKARARDHVLRYGVPVVPGFDAKGLSDAEIAEEAETVGYPLLVKPSAGGGGKGMEVVADAAGLRGALASARRVASAAFGDDALILERLIRRPRHIEVQVFGDVHGTVIALGERECTLQRRHQKVIEEAPSAGIPADTRERLLSAAVLAAESVSYVGAGTVEFLVDADAPDEVFFIEMNTRLQVEHPVTEEVTGLDLVALQLRAAAGLPLDVTPRLRGHAVEARVYAEAPERGFLPSTGTVLLFDPPPGVRVDAAIESGSEVTGFYDPMIAKVIAFADDRATALARLDRALASTVVLGVETNIAFLRMLCQDARVIEGDLDTGLIESLLPLETVKPSASQLAAARDAVSDPPASVRTSPLWRELPGWRLGTQDAPHAPFVALTDDGDEVELDEASPSPSRAGVLAAVDAEGAVWVAEEGRTIRLRPLDRRQRMQRRLSARDAGAAATEPEGRAPMPGSVVAVHVTDGDTVSAGEALVSIEAMKMEHPVLAPHDGVVHLLVAVGDQVRRDQPVARVTTEES